MNAPQKATNAKSGGQKPTEKTDVSKQDSAPLTEEQVRKIVEETLASTMKGLAKSMEDSIKKTVETAIQKSGKSLEDSVGKSVDGKLSNQTNLTKNVQSSTKDIKGILEELKKDMRASGELEVQKFGELKETVSSVTERIGELERTLQDKETDDSSIDVESVSQAVVSLSQMSKSIKDMEESVLIVSTAGNTVQNLQAAAESVRNSAGEIERCTNLLSDDNGRLGLLKNAIDTLSEQAAQSCSAIQGKLQAAEETLVRRQTELTALVRQMDELLSVPKSFQNEVVDRMEKILTSLSTSVSNLSGQLKEMKDRLDGIGDISEFREKTMLSLSFAEAAKSLQTAFEKSMDRASQDGAGQDKMEPVLTT